MAVFLVVTPYRLVEVYRRFRRTCCLNHQGDDVDSKHLWNVGKLLPDFMAQESRRQPSSYTPPWEPESSRVTSPVCVLPMLTRCPCKQPAWFVPPSARRRTLQSTTTVFFVSSNAIRFWITNIIIGPTHTAESHKDCKFYIKNRSKYNPVLTLSTTKYRRLPPNWAFSLTQRFLVIRLQR
jgi:hypothetical protein